jgi:hypothetical protein
MFCKTKHLSAYAFYQSKTPDAAQYKFLQLNAYGLDGKDANALNGNKKPQKRRINLAQGNALGTQYTQFFPLPGVALG